MDAILALIVALLVFVPCAAYGAGKLRPGARKEQPQAELDRDEARTAPPATVVQKVTALAVTSIRLAIGFERQAEPGDEPPRAAPSAPRPNPGPADDWRDPDLDDLEDLLGGRENAPKPPLWADTEVIRAPRAPREPLPALEELDREALPLARGREQETIDRVARETTPPAPAAPHAIPAVAGQMLDVDHNPVTLEGIDMSQAPIVPTPDGSAIRLPGVAQMQAALATGGFERLMSWLRAFKKASNNTLTQAQTLHVDAMMIARRTRTKYAMAMQAFQAVQADRLDRQTIARVFAMLEQAHREAIAAAAATKHTAALVVAAGGSQPTVAAAITTLQRNHGAIAVAVKASPQAVPNIGFYKT